MVSTDNSSRESLSRKWLDKAKGILHLGAHVGQEAPQYHKLGKPVVWVEALPDLYERLKENIFQYPRQKALNALLTDMDGQTQTFYVSNNHEGVSSSIYEFGEYGSGERSLWPKLNLAMVDQQMLNTRRLDTLFAFHDLSAEDYDYWVVDLQGAELVALKGAGDLLCDCQAMNVEVSTEEVYCGGVLWPELKAFLEGEGFEASWTPEKEHCDVLFVRSND